MIPQTRHPEPDRPTAARQPRGLFARPLVLALAGIILLVALIGWFYRHNHVFRVEEILDGDTLRIDYHGAARLIQLAGADAPEAHKGSQGQPLSSEARQYLRKRVLHKNVWVEFEDPGLRDDYKGRMLCWVWHGRENLSYSLVARGLALFSGAAEGDRRTILVKLQEAARQNRRGLWAYDARETPRRENRDGAEYHYKEYSEQPFTPEAIPE